MVDARAGDEESEYRVTVDGFDTVRSGRHVVFRMTVSRGTARWPLRRRFRQVVALHTQLLLNFGSSDERRLMPTLPPKWTCRSVWCGQQDGRFLAVRAASMQRYLEQLLRFIPYVDQSEVLREFLCSVDINSMSYDTLLDLGQALGRAGGPQGVEVAAIEALPRSDSGADWVAGAAASRCVICQEGMEPDEDIRVLPCRHEYHFACISQWLGQSNSCCVCQGLAVMQSTASSLETEK